MERLTFEELPRVVQELQEKIDRLTRLVENFAYGNLPDKDIWFDIKQLSEYLPDHPVTKTIYKKVGKNILPYHRRGDSKHLYFLKSEIDQYLKEGKKKKQKEIAEEVDTLLSKTSKRRKRIPVNFLDKETTKFRDS
ncbi:MAG: helix-turn-helix domain-containing protein [Bacteroidetes bacterium]|nr:helix-turn-helix domain-containing protein [Bacteroidota bacterium]